MKSQIFRKFLGCFLFALLLGCGATSNIAGGDINAPVGGPLGGPGGQLSGPGPVQPTNEGQLVPLPEVVAVWVKLPPKRTAADLGGANDGNHMMAMAISSTSSSSGSSQDPTSNISSNAKGASVGDPNLLNVDESVLEDRGPFEGNLPTVMVFQPVSSKISVLNPKFFNDPKKTDSFGYATEVLNYHKIGTPCTEAPYYIWACWIDKGIYYQSQSLELHCPDGHFNNPFGTNPGDPDTSLYLKESSNQQQCPNVLGVQAVQSGIKENAAP